MKISEFQSLIFQLPHKNHGFTIKKSNWKYTAQESLVDIIFSKNETITINRYDLTNSTFHLPEFVIKTLMWGYPTKGRGINIDELLKPANFQALISLLKTYSQNNISLDSLIHDIKNINGLGLSTMSKLITFLGTQINGMNPAILDLRIIDVINSEKFEDLNSLRPIRYDNALKKYGDYTELMNHITAQLGVEIGQLEMFLIVFGKSLSELRGENCYHFD